MSLYWKRRECLPLCLLCFCMGQPCPVVYDNGVQNILFYQQTPGNTSINKGKENLCIERQPKHKVVDHKRLITFSRPLIFLWSVQDDILPSSQFCHTQRLYIVTGGAFLKVEFCRVNKSNGINLNGLSLKEKNA